MDLPLHALLSNLKPGLHFSQCVLSLLSHVSQSVRVHAKKYKVDSDAIETILTIYIVGYGEAILSLKQQVLI